MSNDPNLTPEEQLVMDALGEAGPLDAIGISSRTRLAVPQVLEVIESLKTKHLVNVGRPEPVHEQVLVA